MSRFSKVKQMAWGVALVLMAAVAARSESRPADAGEVVTDLHYDVFSVEADAAPIGAYSITGRRNGRGEVVMIERFEMEHRSRTVLLSSEVAYAGGDPPTPLRASAATAVDGQPCMTGEVSFGDAAMRWSARLLRDPRSGKALDPPRTIEREEPMPDRPLLFQSAAVVLGPQLVAQPGEVQGILFAEFPDDIDEFINVKADYRLIRTEPDEEGRYHIHVLGPESDVPVREVQYDASGRPVGIGDTLGRFKLVKKERE